VRAASLIGGLVTAASALAVATPALAQTAEPPVDCGHVPQTTDLRLLRGSEDHPVALRAPGGFYPGCDADGDPITASVDWGDGTSGPASLEAVADQRGRFTVAATHAYGKAGTYPIVIAQHNERSGVTRYDNHYEAMVAASGVVVRLRPSRLRGRRFAGTLARVPRTGMQLRDRYRATISWGDGSSHTGVVSAGANALSVSGSHTWRRTTRRAEVVVTLTDLDDGAIVMLRRSFRLARR
jgi:hypothetical protein